MRKSVLTGLFACTLVFVGSTASASATTQEQTNQTNEPTVVELLTLETNRTLVVLAESDELAIRSAETATPVVPPAETKHVVTENESLSDIAKKYETTWNRIYDKNVTIENPDVIAVGIELIVPKADEVLEPRTLPTLLQPSHYPSGYARQSSRYYRRFYCSSSQCD